MYTNKMKKYRQEREMTLENLSKKTGISIGYLCHLERGTRVNPSTQIMDKIAAALKKSVHEVFLDE